MSRPLTLFRLSVLLFSCLPSVLYGATPHVAVTIKPVYSLVAGLMAGIGEPELIISNNASPHHYSLRPSERRLIANADLVIWVSPELETFMPRVINSMKQDNTLGLIDVPEMEHLPARSTHQHDSDTHTSSNITDPHIWLSPVNATAIVDAVSRVLSSMDPDNQQHYETNREKLNRRINSTNNAISTMLSGMNEPFLTYHDAYQYFEKAYALNNAGFVSAGAEVSPSARQVHNLREKIQREDIHCLLYEAPYRPALADTLTHNLDVRSIEVDAIGVRLPANQDTWFELMTRIAEAYAACLQP